MMEAAGAGPSVGAGVDGVIAAIANDALEFVGDQIERAIPRHRDVSIRSATIASAAGALLEPSCAHCGLRDAAGMMQRVGNRVKQGRRIRIAGEGARLGDASIEDDWLERAPMRVVE